MAKRATMKETPPADTGIHAGDFQRDMAEINRQKSNASEYTGAAGKLTREAIDRHHLERAAFSFVMRVSKMDAAKRQEAIRSVFNQIEAAGFLDQVDAFNDLTADLNRILEKLEGREPKPAKADGVLGHLVN